MDNKYIDFSLVYDFLAIMKTLNETNESDSFRQGYSVAINDFEEFLNIMSEEKYETETE